MFLHIYTTNSKNFLNPFIDINYFQSNPIFCIHKFTPSSFLHLYPSKSTVICSFWLYFHYIINLLYFIHLPCIIFWLYFHYIINLLYFLHLPCIIPVTRTVRTSFYKKIKNLLTLILMKTSIYSKMIAILKHCNYQIVCIKFLT